MDKIEASALAIRKGVYGIVIHEAKVLMCHTWCRARIIKNFPGGAVDAGESLEQALRREFREEVGAEPEIGPLLYACDGTQSDDFPDMRLAYSYYRVYVPAKKIRCTGNGDDVERLEWFPLDKLPFAEMLAVDRIAWQALCSGLT